MHLLKREIEAEIESLEKRKNRKKDGLGEAKKELAKKKKASGSHTKFNFRLCNVDYKTEKDFTKEGLDMIAMLDGQVKVAATKKAQDHNRRVKRQQDMEKPSSDMKKQKAGGSLFTDADFEAVSKMHFVNSQKVVFKDD